MYKRIKGKKFSRKTDQRRAFMRALVLNLVMQERIKTTKVRARQAASLAEKMITKAKKNDLAAKKYLAAVLSPAAGQKLITAIAPRFKERQGGYTRVVKIAPRAKDGAPMAVVELLDRPVVDKKAKNKAEDKKKDDKKSASKPKKENEKKEKNAAEPENKS